MAGRPKKRIDYAGWSVDIFSSDTKIDKLLDAQGWIGFGVYFYLCQMAFGSEGYYYEWCYDLCATTARKMGGGVSAGTVKETVDYCLRIGLFNKRLFDRWGVLTSKGIQKSYLIVLKSKNRKGTEVYKEFWLLDKNDEDYQGVIFVRKNKDLLEENAHLLGENSHSLGENEHSLGQKESKVKDSKEKENISEPASVDSMFNIEQAWNDTFEIYPKKSGAVMAHTVWMDKLVPVIESNRKDVAILILCATQMYLDDYKEKNPNDTNFQYIPKYENWLKNDCDYWIQQYEETQKANNKGE